MAIEKFTAYLSSVNNGLLDDELTEFILKSVNEIRLNGGKYEINLKVKITGREIRDELFIDITPTYTTKHTPVEIGGNCFPCPTSEGTSLRLELPETL